MVREGLISGDQFEKLSALDGTDMEKIASVLKRCKDWARSTISTYVIVRFM